MESYFLKGICILAVVVVVYFYAVYVSLIKKRNKLKEASADVDVQLKKRYDLIPNILNMASKYMEHEKTLLAEIVRLRSEALKQNFAAHPNKCIELENALDDKLKSFWVNLENYPDLKASQTMIQGMQTFSETEEHIAAARRFYNAALTDLKNVVEIFPSSLVASWVGVKADSPFFTASEEAKERIDVRDFLK